MAAEKSTTNIAVLSLAIFAVLSLQKADAQTTPCNCTFDYNFVPGWGIAIIVMTALLLLACLISCCIVPLMCKKGGDGCGSCGASSAGCCGQ